MVNRLGQIQPSALFPRLSSGLGTTQPVFDRTIREAPKASAGVNDREKETFCPSNHGEVQPDGSHRSATTIDGPLVGSGAHRRIIYIECTVRSRNLLQRKGFIAPSIVNSESSARSWLCNQPSSTPTVVTAAPAPENPCNTLARLRHVHRSHRPQEPGRTWAYQPPSPSASGFGNA